MFGRIRVRESVESELWVRPMMIPVMWSLDLMHALSGNPNVERLNMAVEFQATTALKLKRYNRALKDEDRDSVENALARVSCYLWLEHIGF